MISLTRLTQQESTRLKIELLCQGVRVIGVDEEKNRGGAGPTDGLYMVLPNDIIIDAPRRGEFVERSSYALRRENGNNILTYYDEYGCDVEILEWPDFYNDSTSDGIPFWKIAKMHGLDTLGITIDRNCSLWYMGEQCGFCTIKKINEERKEHNGVPLDRKRPIWVGETVAASKCKSVVLTAGQPERERDLVERFCDSAQMAKRYNPNVTVQAQVPPFKNPGLYNKLRKNGVDSVGIHIDAIGEDAMARFAPGKYKIGRWAYFTSWDYARKVFGPNQVSTFLLIGLGENVNEREAMIDTACENSVIPFIVPHRPTLGTKCSQLKPVEAASLAQACIYAAEKMEEYGLNIFDSKAGCPRCGACTPLREVVEYGIE